MSPPSIEVVRDTVFPFPSGSGRGNAKPSWRPSSRRGAETEHSLPRAAAAASDGRRSAWWFVVAGMRWVVPSSPGALQTPRRTRVFAGIFFCFLFGWVRTSRLGSFGVVTVVDAESRTFRLLKLGPDFTTARSQDLSSGRTPNWNP